MAKAMGRLFTNLKTRKMKITDKEKTEFLIKLAKEHYSQGDDYHAWKSKKDKWHFGHSNDYELQHGQGNNTIIDDSMLEILMNREAVNDLPIANVIVPKGTVCELTEWDGGNEANLCDCGKGEGNCKKQTAL